MAEFDVIRTLKSSPARSVRLERQPHSDDGEDFPRDEAARVVKRFASHGLLSAPRDAARARREYTLLKLLYELGLPVPRPLSIERRGQGWEVSMQWIPQAQTLQDHLLAGSASELSARALGRLLARLQSAGIDHPDLHPGNVLIDGEGHAWAIDFHKARRVSSLSPARLEAQVAHLAAGMRERTSARFRARCLLAWLRHLPPDQARPRGERSAIARRVEERGRSERLTTVERRRLRWTRAGTAVRPVTLSSGDAFERCDAPEGLARTLEAALEREGPGATRVLLPCGSSQPRRVLALRGSWRAVSAAWYTAARLEEHDLPAARPLAIARGEPTWAAFALPAEGHLLEEWSQLKRVEELRGLGALAAALHDRGLALARLAPEHLWVAADGSLSIACAPRLVAALGAATQGVLDPWCAVLGASALQREQLVGGFLSALDCAGAERARIAHALRRGKS